MQNPFTNTAFSMTALTNALNILPINYGRVENLNLFPSKSVRFRHITIEEQNGVLSLLPTQLPGAPATVGKRGKRKVRTFTIPHIPHDDVVLPEEVQGIRAFGSESELKALADVITDHLQLMRNKHAITLEHLRMGALKGIILDADGSELLNLYNEFEIAPKVVNFALGTASTFTTYFAPADFNETVNTLGQPLYAKQEPRRFDRGTDLHTQSNPLPMCHRPATLIKIVAT
ncbi:major capsid protein [Wolbachia endosymbiont of Carposina sasakii]|uniref:major capsid protein n=1 Tax=Wolbachia endosymbiont of Carposina sasakii TaxID=2591635 RepID=UPI0011450F1B|nr:major capsid protein [Wolbachia endosymbiont of Carposina sasakii]QDH18923.1 major capsid protein [Wolbachia endosymbiont of Carposina sasakii]